MGIVSDPGGPGEGICEGRPRGRGTDPGVDTGTRGLVGASAGTRMRRGGHGSPALRARRGAGPMTGGTAPGGFMRSLSIGLP